MRTSLKAIVLALAVVFTVSTGSAFAAAAPQWKKVSVQEVPVQVMTGYRSLFSHSKITKAEKSGTGVNTQYRLTIRRKGKPEAVIFDAQGHAQ